MTAATRSRFSLWLLTIPLATFQVISARELGALMFLMPLQIRKILNVCANGLDVSLSVAGRLGVGLLIIVRALLYVLAAPLLPYWPLPSLAGHESAQNNALSL